MFNIFNHELSFFFKLGLVFIQMGVFINKTTHLSMTKFRKSYNVLAISRNAPFVR